MLILPHKKLISNLMDFTHVDFGKIRGMLIDNDPWFVGKDVAIALGYKNTKDALARHVDDDDKRGSHITTPSGEQLMTIINESGLYSLIFGSRLETAKNFKKWVTRNVLPSIRRFGCYIDDNHDNLRELSKCVFNSLKSGIEIMIEYGNEYYNIDEEDIRKTMSGKANKLAGIENGHRDIASAEQLIKLICVQASFLKTIIDGIKHKCDFCNIVNRCDDDAVKELERFSFKIIPASEDESD